MNKQDLTKIIRKEYGFSWSDSKRVVEILLSSIREELRSGGKITLQGFGTFSVKEFSAKKYRDIQTGKIMTKGVFNKVKFKPSKNILTPWMEKRK